MGRIAFEIYQISLRAADRGMIRAQHAAVLTIIEDSFTGQITFGAGSPSSKQIFHPRAEKSLKEWE
jgi:hypothetical protein